MDGKFISDFISCPFNIQHRVLRTNMQKHIIRCMKNHPEWVQCSYNAMHWFPTKNQMLEHMRSCPSQKYMVQAEEDRNKTVEVRNTIYETNHFHKEFEDWDDEDY